MLLCLVGLKKGIRAAVLGNPVADKHLADMRVLFYWRKATAFVLRRSDPGQGMR